MARYDLRLDIPVRAIINANLVSYAERGGTLFEAKKQFFQHDWKEAKEQNLDPYNYTLDDHSLAISLLYCTIVVPRELLDLPANHKIYREFDAKDITTLFDVQAPRGTLPILFCGDIAPYAVCEAVGTAGQPLRAAPTIDTTALAQAGTPGASLQPCGLLDDEHGADGAQPAWLSQHALRPSDCSPRHFQRQCAVECPFRVAFGFNVVAQRRTVGGQLRQVMEIRGEGQILSAQQVEQQRQIVRPRKVDGLRR